MLSASGLGVEVSFLGEEGFCAGGTMALERLMLLGAYGGGGSRGVGMPLRSLKKNVPAKLVVCVDGPQRF